MVEGCSAVVEDTVHRIVLSRSRSDQTRGVEEDEIPVSYTPI